MKDILGEETFYQGVVNIISFINLSNKIFFQYFLDFLLENSELYKKYELLAVISSFHEITLQVGGFWLK